MTLPHDLIGAAILGSAFAAVFVAAELWRRFGHPDPEWTRKLVHTGGGLASLLYPWLIYSPWVVLGMALVASGVLAAAGRGHLLSSVHGVNRRSQGSEYYPLAVALVYVLSYGRPWLFVASILTLAVSDTCAALIGTRYGSIRYTVEEETKSLEGSLAFLLVAFLAIHIPTLLMTDIPRPVCVLAALLVAVIVTGFEAISLRGADNLFVPVAVCVILAKITTKPLAEVAAQNFSIIAIATIFIILARRMRTLNAGAVIALILFAFGAWSLGSWQWALPVLLGFVAYHLAQTATPPPDAAAPAVRVRLVVRAVLPPLFPLILSNMFTLEQFFYGPYLATGATVTGLTLWTYLRRQRPAALRGAFACSLGGALLVLLVPWALQGLGWRSLAAPAALSLLAIAANALVVERLRPPQDNDLWRAGKMLLCYAVTAAIIAAQQLGLAALWRPE